MEIIKFLMDNEKIVKSVLREYKIYPNRFDYDDFAQELRIKLMEDFERIVSSNVKIQSIEAYLRSSLRWKMNNLLRTQKRHQIIPVEDTQLLASQSVDDPIGVQDYWLAFDALLTEDEQALLHYLYAGYTFKQLSGIFNRQSRTIRRWRDALVEKLRSFYKEQ